MKIGIDIGNVIISGAGVDTIFVENYLETPEVDHALGSISDLQRAGHEIHIISKCGLTIEGNSMDWLDYSGFMTFLVRHRIHFVRKRHLKAPMAQALELDIFIDDRQDIIDSMEGIVKHPILFTSWEETNKQLSEILGILS